MELTDLEQYRKPIKIVDDETKIIDEQFEYKKILLTTLNTSIKLTKLQKEIIHILRTLKFNNLKTMTTGLNPNNIHGSDENLKLKILENLKILKKVGLVKKQKNELWVLKEDLKFKKKEITNLEKKILQFIDKETWDIDIPKITIKIIFSDEIQGRSKLKYKDIRREILNFPKGKRTRYTYSEVLFNRALNTLKARKLITSRTKNQTFLGLTCTQKGHNLVLDFFNNKI